MYACMYVCMNEHQILTNVDSNKTDFTTSLLTRLKAVEAEAAGIFPKNVKLFKLFL